jgi:hypothetical protein
LGWHSRGGHRRHLHRPGRDDDPAGGRRTDRDLGAERDHCGNGLLRAPDPEPELLLCDNGAHLRHRWVQHRKFLDRGRNAWDRLGNRTHGLIVWRGYHLRHYFGDKASPLSDTANLAAAVAGSGIYDHIRESLFTSVPALAVAVAVFAILGSPGDFDATAILSRIEQNFTISPLAFIPLLVVLVLSLVRFAPFVTIFIGALVGGIVPSLSIRPA